MIELDLDRVEQTMQLGRRLGRLATLGDVFALDGELGAGKTQLIRGLAQGLGHDPRHVSSPTFVLMHEHLADDPDTLPLIHIDAYRVTGPDDLATLGFDRSLRESSVTAVEWARLIADLPDPPLGPQVLHLQMQHAGQQRRRVTLTPHGRWSTLLQQTDLQAV
jgi:tRNA threonylcarbamoyladenosine biosynthesis protein TsaE